MTHQLLSEHLVTKIESSRPPSAARLRSSALSLSAEPLSPAPAAGPPGAPCRTPSRVVRLHRRGPHWVPEAPGELESKRIALPLVLGEDGFQDALFEIS
jgi:hypothetical protein